MAPLLALTLALGAAATEPSASLQRRAVTWQEALHFASEGPEANAARAAAEAQRELRPTGLGNPEISLSAGERFGDRSNQGFDGSLSLTQPFALAPVGSSRGEAVRAEARALDAQAAFYTLDARLEAAEAFCQLYAAEARRSLQREALGLAEELLSRLRDGRERGAFTSRDVAKARGEAADAKLAWLEAESQAVELGIRLARLSHSPASAVFQTSGGLPQVQLPPPAQRLELLADVERLPSVLQEELAATAARHRLRESEVAGKALWLRVGATILQEGPQDRALLGTLSFDLPFFERRQRERGDRLAERSQQEGRSLRALLDARAFTTRLQEEVVQAEREAEVHRSEHLPAAEESARLADVGLRQGFLDLEEWSESQVQLLLARAGDQLAQARLALARLRLALVLDALGSASHAAAPSSSGATP